MPEQPEQTQDIVSIAAELETRRAELREAKQTADRVPALEREVERAKTERDRATDKAREKARENGELETKLRELESQIRAQGELEAERDAATDDAEAARAEAIEARESAELSEGIINSQQEKIAEKEREIERLRGHEKQTRTFLDAIDSARKLG